MIKKVIPIRTKKKLKKWLSLWHLFMEFLYDARLYFRHSNYYFRNNSRKKLLTDIVRQYHVIEKGLTMPEMRAGFGKDRIFRLINDCRLFAKKYGTIEKQFVHALGVLLEYKQAHEKNDLKMDSQINRAIGQIIDLGKTVRPSKQKQITREEYFRPSKDDFMTFSNSRHSVRHFSGKVEIKKMKRAIELAQNAPSACNRQPSTTYIVDNKDAIATILSLQKGNRGFGHRADKLLIITADLGGYISVRERNGVFVDGGIYSMNLLYSLHYYEIGACSLNWSSEKKDDVLLRKILKISESERIIMIIACGDVPEKFSLASSMRNSIKIQIF